LKHPRKQNPDDQTPKQSIQISQTQATFYSGKLPSPEMMAQYNSVDPTFANRILSMAEQEQRHVQKMEKKQLNVQITSVLSGLCFGFFALCVLCYVLYLSIKNNNTTVSLSLIGLIISVTTIFVLRKRAK